MKCKTLLWGSVSVAAIILASGPSFGQDNTTMETVVVTGIRASIEKGLEAKRESTQVIESIVAEDIGKLPDNNVIEALQRLTGVQVSDRGGGDVSTIYIRGMSDVQTSWNGRNVFTASGRYFALADIPANFIQSVDVYKTRSADQLETGIAGQVDVKTHRPFDFDGLQVSAAGRDTYEQRRGSFDPNMNMLISDRWTTGIGDIGALVNVSYVQTRFRDESVTAGAMVPFAASATTGTLSTNGWSYMQRIMASYSGTEGNCGSTGAGSCSGLENYGTIWAVGQNEGLSEAEGATITLSDGTSLPYYLSRDAIFSTDYIGNVQRPSMNIALQWAPSENSTYTFEFFYDGYRTVTDNQMLFSYVDWWGDLGSDASSNVTLYPGTNIVKSRTDVGSVYGFQSGDVTSAKTNSFIYALNAKWQLSDRLNVTADLSYQSSAWDEQFIAMRFERTAGSISVDFNNGNGVTEYSFDDNSLLTEASSWNSSWFYDNAYKDKGDAVTFQADGNYNLEGLIPFAKKVAFGLRYDDRSAAEYERTQSAYTSVAISSLDSKIMRVNKDFFTGIGVVPRSYATASGTYLKSNIDTMRTLYGLKTSDDLSLSKDFNIDEKTASAYIQVDGGVDILGNPLQVQAGVRYVDVTDSLTFTEKARSNSHDFLPSATARYSIGEDAMLRFNYGETVRRPSFSNLNPTYTLTDDLTKVGYGTASAGNKDLKPTHSKNMDVTAEWYFQPGSALYVTGFRRLVDGLVVSSRSVETFDASTKEAGSTKTATKWVVTKPMNASDGDLKGVELGVVYFPKELPGWFDGIGFQGSLTYITSTQNVPQTNSSGEIVSQARSSFIGVSNWSYNTTLAYEHGPAGLRLSYVWRNKFYYGNESALFANPIGIWRRPEASLDLQLNYKIGDKLMATFDAVNMLEGLQQSYYAFGGAGGPELGNFGTTVISRTFSIGLRYSLN